MSVFSQDELDVIREAHNIIALKFQRGESFTNSQLVSDYLITQLAIEEQEVFRVMLLDNQHRLICDVELARGTINTASVSPRDVAKAALAHNAAAVILAHNHPSGIPTPSASDKQFTAAVVSALLLFEVRTLDHLIVGGAQTYSFAAFGDL